MGVPMRLPRNFGPLEEPAGVDRLLKGRPIDEDVGVALTLARPRLTGGPTPAQPEGGVLRNEFRRKRALAGPTGADEHEDQWISAQSL